MISPQEQLQQHEQMLAAPHTPVPIAPAPTDAASAAAAAAVEDAVHWQRVAADTDKRAQEQQQAMEEYLASMQGKLADSEAQLLHAKQQHAALQQELEQANNSLMQADRQHAEQRQETEALHRSAAIRVSASPH